MLLVYVICYMYLYINLLPVSKIHINYSALVGRYSYLICLISANKKSEYKLIILAKLFMKKKNKNKTKLVNKASKKLYIYIFYQEIVSSYHEFELQIYLSLFVSWDKPTPY